MGLPRYLTNREYESNLSEARIQAGFKIIELCEKAKVNITTYCRLNSGMQAPIDRYSGKVIKSAQSLADILNMELSDLWPRYFCEINRYAEFSDDEVIDYFHQGLLSKDNDDPELILLEKEGHQLFRQTFSQLKGRRRDVFVGIILNGMTRNELAIELGISYQTVMIIEQSLYQYIRSQFTKDQLLDILNYLKEN